MFIGYAMLVALMTATPGPHFLNPNTPYLHILYLYVSIHIINYITLPYDNLT